MKGVFCMAIGTQNPIVCSETTGTLLNSQYVMEIDITPFENYPTWVSLKNGISSMEPVMNDVTEQTNYYDSAGYGITSVTGGQFVISFSGDRVYGDEALDYIFKQMWQFGCGRKTNFKMTDPAYNAVSGIVTIANITGPGGDSGKGSFSFELHFDGEPLIELSKPLQTEPENSEEEEKDEIVVPEVLEPEEAEKQEDEVLEENPVVEQVPEEAEPDVIII